MNTLTIGVATLMLLCCPATAPTATKSAAILPCPLKNCTEIFRNAMDSIHHLTILNQMQETCEFIRLYLECSKKCGEVDDNNALKLLEGDLPTLFKDACPPINFDNLEKALSDLNCTESCGPRSFNSTCNSLKHYTIPSNMNCVKSCGHEAEDLLFYFHLPGLNMSCNSATANLLQVDGLLFAAEDTATQDFANATVLFSLNSATAKRSSTESTFSAAEDTNNTTFFSLNSATVKRMDSTVSAAEDTNSTTFITFEGLQTAILDSRNATASSDIGGVNGNTSILPQTSTGMSKNNSSLNETIPSSARKRVIKLGVEMDVFLLLLNIILS